MNWDQFQKFIYYRTYSRWRDELGRRETWEETVDRLMNFFVEELPKVSPNKFELSTVTKNTIERAIKNCETMPSMRALWAAGEAAKASHVTLYNCSFVVFDDVAAFSEILYVLMCGTGAGFSVEREFVDKLPVIGQPTGKVVKIAVGDSKDGWAGALDKAIRALYKGHTIEPDYSAIRKRGARLITMGGRASGPEPLMRLMDYLQKLFKRKAGHKLRSIDVHDIACMEAEIVVVGGVRRSSEISLSDLDDSDMARAKFGEFFKTDPQRSMANNSAVYKEKPGVITFMREWLNLIVSNSGERGIFNREGAQRLMTANGRRVKWTIIGTNPCAEIILRSMEFCNLSSVVIRPEDTLQTLREKVRVATIIGTIQSAFTNFPFLRPEWKANCDEERLLGVSLNGEMDHPVLSVVTDETKLWLSDLKHMAIETNRNWARKLGINASAAITCVKPEGTGSKMLGTASGIHPRYAKFQKRRVRISATDPLFAMLRDQGVPCSPENGQEPGTADTWVLTFPLKAPTGAKTRHDVTALMQLEHWKMVREFWAEHSVSMTCYVAENEWLEVGAWVYRHFDHITGLSFLPKGDDHAYAQAPEEEITEEEYAQFVANFPQIDFSQLSRYETEDMTEGAKQLACSGGTCEI
jgi:ribonucleoside-diphosphate reductase alpha chain